LTFLSVSIVVAALLAVVVGQALLANGQVRMSTLQHDLALEQAAHRQSELAVAQLETPARIVAAATGAGMIRPANVVELPYVSLTVPLPTPNVTPAPAPPPPPATTAASASTAGSGAASATTSTSGSGAPSAGAGSTASTTTATSTP